jgi:hypothetical protein
MQAGLKCDQVPWNAALGRNVPTHIEISLSQKRLTLQQDAET